MSESRRQVRMSVDERPLEVWEGTSVAEAVGSVVPGFMADAVAGRASAVDAAGRRVDLDREVVSGEILYVVPVPHPGTKPI